MRRLPPEILLALKARTARGAIGASTMRSAGAKGAVAAGREFLTKVDLRAFSTPNPSRFRRQLDATTVDLQHAFPRGARHWGLARKSLNIFLRDCLSNVYLRNAYSLQVAEAFYEIPLDSYTGEGLHRSSGGAVPRWKTVQGITRDLNDQFQAVAALIAKERRIARIHLDAIWWGQRDD